MKLWIAGLAAAVSFCTPASAEVVAVSDAGFVIRVSAEVTASPQDAWKELVTPAGWWNKAHTFSGDSANLYLDSQATGCFCEKLPLPKGAEGQRPGSVEHMRIVYVEPGKALRMVGALGPLQSEALSGTLTITLKPVGGNTRILWEYVVGGYMRYKISASAVAELEKGGTRSNGAIIIEKSIDVAVDKVLAEQLGSLAAKLGPIAPPPAAAKGEPAAGKMKIAPKPLDDAETQTPNDKADTPPPVDAPDESKAEAEEPKPASAKPARPGRRQPKPDDEYVEPTR